MIDDDDHLTTNQVASWLGYAPKTLRNWRHTGGGPPARKIGPGRSGSVRYRRGDVRNWAAARTETRTHEPARASGGAA